MNKFTKGKYKVVIGLEVHVQLATKSKIFASDSTKFGCPPNTNISTITLGHPGVLPKLNRKVVEYAVKMGLACECKISRYNIFDRKNYFYPDLPKGYQVTQEKTPICIGGGVYVTLGDGVEKKVQLNRIHLEEDAGKSIHAEGTTDTWVDYNRAGQPLIEIVTDPVMSSAEEAGAFLTEIRKKVRHLGICDGNMEEGSMRCDANVSIMPVDATELGNKVEVKNMNSIRNVQLAINYEIKRQVAEAEKENVILKETRLFDVDRGITNSMRVKEDMNDYRYFPEPDLAPFEVTDEWLEEIKESMPALPRELKKKFIAEYNLSEASADFLAESRDRAEYFIALCAETTHYRKAANWLMGPIKSYLNEHNILIGDLGVSHDRLADLFHLIDEGDVSNTAAEQKLLPYMIKNQDISAEAAAKKLNLIQESDEDNLQLIINEVLTENAKKVKEFKKGKKGLVGMFMGQVMKKSQGKADPKVANKLLQESLQKL